MNTDQKDFKHRELTQMNTDQRDFKHRELTQMNTDQRDFKHRELTQMNTDQRDFKHRELTQMNTDQRDFKHRELTQMNTDLKDFKHRELPQKIIGVFYEVYNELGHGFLESVYEQAMVIALRQAELEVIQQSPAPVHFGGQLIGDFRADILVENTIIIELKAARTLESAHEAQLLNYLKATEIEVGLLMNFGPKPEFKRFIFDNERKRDRPRTNTDEHR